MQRNTLFGGIALLLAGGVIGAGAMISSSAMADEGGTPPANEVTMINVGADGKAVQCTFSGAEADDLFPAMPLTSDAIEVPISDDAGFIEIDPEHLPAGMTVESGVVSVQADAGSGGIVDTNQIAALPDDVQLLSTDDAREGTSEECAAMREQMASGVQGDGAMVIGATGTIAGSASVEPIKP